MTSADYSRDQRVIELRLANLEEGNKQILVQVSALREESIRRRAYWRVVAVIAGVAGGLASLATKLLASLIGS